MPFKSEAQRRKFYAMKARGQISSHTVKKWEAHTPKGKRLPERLHKKAEAGMDFTSAFIDELRKLSATYQPAAERISPPSREERKEPEYKSSVQQAWSQRQGRRKAQGMMLGGGVVPVRGRI